MTKKNQNNPPLRRDSVEDPSYRPGVGLAIFNPIGDVLIGERLDNPGSWQMPQGGIDPGEALETAIFREMKEEIGTDHARILAMLDDWIYYDFPQNLARKLWNGQYRGQRQKWVALQFLGDDSDINLAAHRQQEFAKWRWLPLGDILSHIVPFKRDVYRLVIKEFSDFAKKQS